MAQGRARGTGSARGGPPHGLVVRVQVAGPRRQTQADALGHPVDDLGQLALVVGEGAVRQSQPDHLALVDAQLAQRVEVLLPAAACELCPGDGVAVRVRAFPVGRHHDAQPHAGGGEHREGSADAERLVVGVRGQHESAGDGFEGVGRQPLQGRPACPVAFTGAGCLDRIGRRPAAQGAHCGVRETGGVEHRSPLLVAPSLSSHRWGITQLPRSLVLKPAGRT
jgi:hypothetical protein